MKVLPFPCIRPVPERAAEVAALPYDVFDRAEAAAYVANHPLSFLAIDRPETQFAPDADMYAPEVYARGAKLLHERIDEGIYQADPSMSYYLYELTQDGRTQTGVVAICSVDEYDQGIIKKHENTRAEKERDRIEHIRALGCQTGPIFLTYRDEPVLSFILAQVKTGQALYDFTDEEGVRQRVWEVRRPESVEAIREMFARVPCAYIADGHHRTASAMRVAHEMRAAAFTVCRTLRAAGIVTEANYQGRSLKSQFKQADKLGAALIVVVGGDELAEGRVRLRDMRSHEEELVELDALAEAVRTRL